MIISILVYDLHAFTQLLSGMVKMFFLCAFSEAEKKRSSDFASDTAQWKKAECDAL